MSTTEFLLRPKRRMSPGAALPHGRDTAHHGRELQRKPRLSSHKAWSVRFGLAPAALWLAIGALLDPAAAVAQVTTVMDSGAGSLRDEVEASLAGDTISIELGAGTNDLATIPLGSTLSFDNTVTIDNSDTAFGRVEIMAPASGNFLEIEDDVNLTFKDVRLLGDGNILLQGMGSTLTLNARREAQTIDAMITGGGTIRTESSAVLTLAGDLTGFTGILDVGGDPGFGGLGSVTLNPTAPTSLYSFDILLNEALNGLIIEGPNQITFSGDITGNGEFVKKGVGTTILTGTASHTGRTTLDVGTLVGNTNNLQGLINVASGANLSFDQMDAGTFDGEIRSPVGAIVVNKMGTGALTFNTAQTWTGDLNILAGRVIGDTTNLQRTLNITSGAALDFNQATAGTFTGDIQSVGGPITVRKTGAGALTFNTPQAYEGSLFVQAGSVILDADQSVTGDLFVNGGSLFLNADQSFSGNLNVEGGGLFINANQTFTGLVDASSGSVQFSNGADLTNAAGLTLGSGAGSATTTTLSSTRTATAGADNTFSIGGDLTINADGRLLLELNDVPEIELRNTVFQAAGNVQLNGTPDLEITRVTGGFAGTTTFDVVRGTAVNGDFNIVEGFQFLDFAGSVVGGDTYQLTVSQNTNTLAQNATTTNQIAVAGPLDLLRMTPAVGDPSLLALQSALNIVQTSEIGGLLESAAADDLAASTNVQLAASTRTWRSLSNRLALQRRRAIGHHDARAARLLRARSERAERLRTKNRRPERRPSVEAGPATAALPSREDKPWVAWLEGRGAIGELDSNASKGYDYKLIGPMIGADSALTPEFRIGFGVGSSHSRYDTTGQVDNQGVSHSAEGLVYGAWVGAPIEILVGARYAHTWVETDRRFEFSSISERIEAEFEGDQFGAYVELTRGFVLPAQLEIAPLVSVAYTHLMWDSFNESGTSALRMRVEESDVDSAITSLGLRFSGEWEMEDGILITPRLKALWNHEWADIEREVSGSFAAAPVSAANNLTLEGAEVPRDYAEVGLGWEVGYRRNANLFIDWDGRFGEDLIENSVSVGVRVAW